MKAFRGSQPLQPVVKVYGLLSLQDLLDRVPSEVEHSPADSSAEVRYGTYGSVPVTVAIPNEVRGV